MNVMHVISRCEVGQCQEFDWDETEFTLMLLLDTVSSQVSAEQCASNASWAACKYTVPWLIECVVVSNKCFKLACAGTASAVQPTGLQCARSSEKAKEQPAECSRCNDPTVSHLTCDLTPSILGSDALGSRRRLLLAWHDLLRHRWLYHFLRDVSTFPFTEILKEKPETNSCNRHMYKCRGAYMTAGICLTVRPSVC